MNIATSTANTTAHITAENFNRECFCISLDKQALASSMAADIDQAELFALVQGRLPSLF